MSYAQAQNIQPSHAQNKRFDYNKYVEEIQARLGSESVFRQGQQSSFNQYLASDIERFRKDLSYYGAENNGVRRAAVDHGYVSDSLANSGIGGSHALMHNSGV